MDKRCKFHPLPPCGLFTWSCFHLDNTLFFHGGFDPVKPNHPLDSMIAIDLSRQQDLNQKLLKFDLLEDKKPDR